MADKLIELRVLVCGDRAWDDPWPIRCMLDGLLHRYGADVLVIGEGGADGGDRMASDWAARNLPPDRHKRFDAHWDHDPTCPSNCRRVVGRAAGPIRNREQYKAFNPHVCIALHDDLSRSTGTRDMVGIARDGHTPVYLISHFRDVLRPLGDWSSEPKLALIADEPF